MLFERLLMAASYSATPPVFPTTLYGFGDNAQGATGLNTATGTTNSPTAAIDGHNTWTKVAIGPQVGATQNVGVLGLLSNGTLWSWGCNFLGGTPPTSSGSIGQGNNTNAYYVPTQVGSTTTWTDIAMTRYGGLAIQSNGTLWSFGDDGNGELGHVGATKYVPTQVGSGTTWAKVFSGFWTTFLIDTSGQLWALGNNINYATGLATSSGNTTTPTQVGSATNWVQIAVGIYGGIGIQSNGTAWSWGTDISGELCQGSSGGTFTTPHQIGALTDWAWAATDCYDGTFSFLIDTNGKLWTAGNNQNYATGLGTNSGNTTTVTQVGTATTWKQVACLNDNTTSNTSGVAIRTNGTAWSWGINANGQTGQGTTSGTTNNPTQIGSATNWTGLSYTSSGCVVFLIN